MTHGQTTKPFEVVAIDEDMWSYWEGAPFNIEDRTEAI